MEVTFADKSMSLKDWDGRGVARVTSAPRSVQHWIGKHLVPMVSHRYSFIDLDENTAPVVDDLIRVIPLDREAVHAALSAVEPAEPETIDIQEMEPGQSGVRQNGTVVRCFEFGGDDLCLMGYDCGPRMKTDCGGRVRLLGPGDTITF
jgi:hypothetical protein